MNFYRAFDVPSGRGFQLWTRILLVPRRMVLLLLAMLCLAFIPDGVCAKVTVTAIWKDGQSVKDTKDVICKHDNWAEEGIYLGMVLKTYDELSSPSGLVYIELTSPKGSVFKGSDKLRIMLLSSREKDVVINVFSGNGEMQSSVGGVMSFGDVSIVVVQTEYAVRVHHTSEGPVREFIVFEGEVEVNSFAPRVRTSERRRGSIAWMLGTRVTSGQKVVFDSNSDLTGAQKAIDSQDIAKSASVYAHIDTAKAMMRNQVDPKETFAKLMGRYTAVFSDPTNANNRIQLAIDQVNLDVNQDALYQLKKAEQFTPPEQNKVRAVIAVTKGAAFAQTGDTGAARKEIQNARALDASILEENNLRSYRFNLKIRTEIRQYKLIAVPPPPEEGTTKRVTWPVPRTLLPYQQKIFKLIREGRFEEARLVVRESPGRLGGPISSIDHYANAVIFYELKDPKNASDAASYAVKQSSMDNLLSRAVYAATQKILQAKKQQ